ARGLAWWGSLLSSFLLPRGPLVSALFGLGAGGWVLAGCPRVRPPGRGCVVHGARPPSGGVPAANAAGVDQGAAAEYRRWLHRRRRAFQPARSSRPGERDDRSVSAPLCLGDGYGSYPEPDFDGGFCDV